MSLLCKLVRCPKEIAESGVVRVVGDQRHCRPLFRAWDYLVVESGDSSEAFRVTEDEVLK